MINAEFKSDIVDVQVILLRTVDRAVLVKRFAYKDDVNEEAKWFPISVAELPDNGDRTHTLTCPEWKLRQEGWL